MTINFTFDALTIILLCISTISMLYIAIFGLRPMRSVARHHRRIKEGNNSEATTDIKASVIVYTRNDEQHIAEYVESLMSQKGVDFEVIIVDDASADHNTSVIEALCNKHPNLYMTFVPGDARSLSRRKLSLTLGMKAAKNEVVITTSAICKITSDRWLYNMVRHFENPNIEIALGYSHCNKHDLRGIGRWYRSFDSLCSATQWLGYALNHLPYRGDGLNLAFRRKNFFEQNGYAQTIYLQYGDDDLFINQFANSHNTAIEISTESQLLINWGKSEPRLWLDRKEHYTFTGRFLKTKAFVNRHTMHAAYWLMTAGSIITMLHTLPDLSATLLISLLFITLWGYMICLYRRAAIALNDIKLWWSIPLFHFIQPLADIIYRLTFRSRKMSNYTWR